MGLKVKLIALLLVISLVPLSAGGYVATNAMEGLNQDAQQRSGERLEGALTSELNSSVEARSAGVQTTFEERESDVESLAASAAMGNYLAANDGEMDVVRQASHEQVGYMAIEMHNGLENARQAVLASEYDGRDWDDLSAAEQTAVEERVERMIAGTDGDGVTSDGTMYRSFQPGYIGDTGYAYITDKQSNIIAHHSLDDGYNLAEDAGGTLRVFDDIEERIDESPGLRNGSEYAVAEYLWEDTTQEGNPKELKFIAYTYYEPFDWILAPNVYYYELQQTAVDDAESQMAADFERYLTTRTVTVAGEERPAYDRAVFAGAEGEAVAVAERTEDGVVATSETTANHSDDEWFQRAASGSPGEVHVTDRRGEAGEQTVYVSTPVYRNDTFRGVVALEFDYSLVTETSGNVTVGESGFLYLIDGDGEVASHPNATLINDGVNVADGEYGAELGALASERMLAGERGQTTHERETADGTERRYVAFAPLEFGDREYVLVGSVPAEDVTEPVAALGASLQQRADGARDTILLLFGGAAVIVAIVGFAAARYVARPIEQVTERATALSDGEFDHEGDLPSRGDEIGEMVDAFEQMQANLDDQVRELETVSRSLREGDLDAEIDTDLPGEFGAIMEDMATGMDQLQTGFAEIARASESVRTGRVDGRVEADLPGDYGDVMDELDAGLAQLDDAFDELTAASTDLRDGRLDRDLDDDLPGAYGEVLANIDEGLDAVADSVARFQAVAEQVRDASEDAAGGAEQIRTASEEVAESVAEISDGADRQANHLDEVVAELGDVSAGVEEVAATSADVAETTREAAERAKRGRERATAATDEIAAIESESEQAVERAEELSAEMERVGEVVDMIGDIAEQTNLLALNANIEAARAGEDGDGFAVVAEEVKSLADEAAEATDEVDRLLGELQTTADETVADMERMGERVSAGSETIGEAIEMFEDVAAAVEDAEHGVEEITDATDDQAASTEEVVTMVDEVASVSDEMAAETGNVSAATEQQTASVGEVSESVGTVADLAGELDRLAGAFEVGAGSEDAPSASVDPTNSGAAASADGGRPTDRNGPTGGDD